MNKDFWKDLFGVNEKITADIEEGRAEAPSFKVVKVHTDVPTTEETSVFGVEFEPEPHGLREKFRAFREELRWQKSKRLEIAIVGAVSLIVLVAGAWTFSSVEDVELPTHHSQWASENTASSTSSTVRPSDTADVAYTDSALPLDDPSFPTPTKSPRDDFSNSHSEDVGTWHDDLGNSGSDTVYGSQAHISTAAVQNNTVRTSSGDIVYTTDSVNSGRISEPPID